MKRLKPVFFCIPLIILGVVVAPSAKSDPGQDYGGQFARGTACEQDAQRSWTTLRSSNGNRRHKVGVAMSPTCKTVWIIAEAPIDSIVALEDNNQSVISGSKTRVSSAGYGSSKMVEYSGQVRACIVIPFSRKKSCSGYRETPF
jgi:hypothetical protein